MPDANEGFVNRGFSELPLAEQVAHLHFHRELLETLCAQAKVAAFGFTVTSFVPHLARSVASRFKTQTPSPKELETYLSGLSLEDFALACACSEGQEAAWDFFVSHYRSYLRRCAGVMLRCAAEEPQARELADSLFAELYGLGDGRRGSSCLFRYFHGRSSLKTWLRAVLAQRHVDGIRAARRFASLDEEDGAGRFTADGGTSGTEGPISSIRPSPEAALGPLALSTDPYRDRYISLFRDALQEALQRLEPSDRQRICWYYAEGKTLAQVGRLCGEHESSVSRNLDRIRRALRMEVEDALRRGRPASNSMTDGGAAGHGLSEAQIALCLQYATEDAPIDFNLLFPGDDKRARSEAHGLDGSQLKKRGENS
jgi:RNA polymerase sigma factor (sigma-70 family)